MADTSLAEIADRLDALLQRIDQPPQRFLTVGQAATYSGLSAESIRRLLAAGKLSPLRPVAGRVLIDRQQLDSLILSSGNYRPRIGRGRH